MCRMTVTKNNKLIATLMLEDMFNILAWKAHYKNNGCTINIYWV